MPFHSLDYFLFLAIVALIFGAIRQRLARTSWLLVCSLLFYGVMQPMGLVFLCLVVVFAFVATRGIAVVKGQQRKWLTGLSVGLILVPLIIYKYLGFVVEQVQWGFPGFPSMPKLALPIGISFYTFQALAYVIDVHRGGQVEKKFIPFATYMVFFPQLLLGPILRVGDLLSQLKTSDGFTAADVNAAVPRLMAGLIKKLLIADVLKLGIVDSIFSDPARFTSFEVLIAIYAYTIQIYYDFSAYTDFAIGSSRLFGFRIPENFNRPYQALSVAQFWRRWHITLSQWVRDYVFFPMGGSRGGGLGPYGNTMIVLLVIGIWHGANWTYIFYGLLHGVAVNINRFWKRSGRSVDNPGWGGTIWRWILTFQFVVFARILFRSESMTRAGEVVQVLLSQEWGFPRFSNHAWIVLIIGFLIHFTPKRWHDRFTVEFGRAPAPVLGIALAIVAAACMIAGVGDTLSFVYDVY